MKSKSTTSPFSFTNTQFLSSPEKRKRINDYRTDKKALKLQIAHLESKLEDAFLGKGVDVGKDFLDDLCSTLEDQTLHLPPADSFIEIFRKRQIEMAK
uniref:Uncharacterized protein n=1 Tax=Amphimedon queenslandica TaxID=400682 RepID=A0A1X7TFV8_AMPQE